RGSDASSTAVTACIDAISIRRLTSDNNRIRNGALQRHHGFMKGAESPVGKQPTYTTVKFAYAITSHLAPTSSNCTCTRA
ncbi:hypothetical protein, partial [Xanthomonas fragariae]|uniref:hypothetical protein n=1 Tax=Xanthomonas fragariae TaxID=48664 RepID=UPI001F3DECC6